MTLTCYCCGESYERGRYRCCAPPNGLASHVWLGQYCRECAKCPKHCLCATKQPRQTPLRPPLAELAEQVARKLNIPVQPEPREWLPYRENREPGEDG